MTTDQIPTHADLSAIYERLKGHCERMDRMEAQQQQITGMTAQVLEILKNGKAFFRLFHYLGAFAKWLGSIAIAIAAIWALLTIGPDK